MNRRDFLENSVAGLALAATQAGAQPPAQEGGQPAARPPRVGLIGCGWYGKADLLRLVQVAPVEVVSLCDVDSRMLNDAAQLVATRQRNHQRPRTFADYREMLRQRNLDIVLIATPDHWHAL
ncbi:MAG TPA: Gfo/Idh/MocA family oxidoreductase, partial [Gemmataceae bacterium]|nr:Gfo/Idh/MocA family oxidoreductase [Gemmataceae bacterium]